MHYREYIRATGVSLLFTFAIYLYAPVLSPFIKSFGLDDFQVSLIFSILPLSIIFTSPIMGRLADRIGRSRVIIIGLIMEIIAMAFYMTSSNWIMLSIARILDAIAIGGVTLISVAKIEDQLSNKERGKYAGLSFSLAHIGAIVAPVVGGIIADHIFVRAPFILTAVLLLFLAYYLTFHTAKTKHKISKKDFNFLSSLKSFMAIRPLKGMAILGMVMHATQPAMTVFLPLYLIERIGVSYTYVGVAIFFLGIMHLFQSYFGRLSDGRERASMVLLGCSIFAFFMFLLSTTHKYWLILVFLFLQGVGSAIWNISAWSLMSDIGEKQKKEGEIVGSYMSLAKIGSFKSFLISGLIVQVFNFETLFIVNAFVVAIGVITASFYFVSDNVLIRYKKL